ncbi:hypothetical protein BH11PLA2_BH11PLA2_48340 [soil metagenome]
MRQTASNFAVFVVLAAAAGALFYFGDKWFFPPKPVPLVPPSPPKVAKDLLGALAGGLSVAPSPFDRMASLPPLPRPVEAAKPSVIKPSEPRALIALGDDSFFLKVLLTNKGAGVQQVVLTQFKDASRLGLELKLPDGKARDLHLVPGYQRPWNKYLAVEPQYVALAPNFTPADLAAKAKPQKNDFDEGLLTRPSYVMYHYPSRDDPSRPLGDDGQVRSEDEFYPKADLGDRDWTITSIEQPAEGPWKVVFETELAAPYFLKVRKTFTLSPKDYDFKLSIDLEPLAGRAKGVGQFRYQIAGPLGMPIEGEWYTSTYRTAYAGWADGSGTERRAVEDPNSIHVKAGSDKMPRLGTFHYAAVGTQYFASAIAVDGQYTEQTQPWEYIRATREMFPSATKGEGEEYDAEKAFLYDITVRAVTAPFDPAPGEVLHQNYAVYNGPIKVRLLKQLEGAQAVAPETVDRYLNQYHLDTLTDFHSPHFFGRFANAIFWSDIVIASSNIMHSLLGFLHGLVGSWGVSIMLLTVMVKLCLIIPSRRQQAINANMQARIATVKPQLDEINAKYKDDFMTLSAEKQKLFRKAGIKQSAQLGGCLLLFAQMPILMGLYFALQESIFFRLTPFLWMQNLAAPDMLAWWSEQIPVISSPDGRFGSFSFLYLGPYFNLLPLFAVVLFYVQQKITMPPPTDDQQEMQQKMMKYMLGFSALFFYKVASGLCVYFIVSGLWSLLERKLVPKPKIDEAKVKASLAGETQDDKPKGWLGKKLAEAKERMEELQKQSESNRQIRHQPQAAGTESLTRNERRAQKKKRK